MWISSEGASLALALLGPEQLAPAGSHFNVPAEMVRQQRNRNFWRVELEAS